MMGEIRMMAPYCVNGKGHTYNLYGDEKVASCTFCGQLERPCWAETWMTVAHAMAMRSYDPRLKVGAIVVSCDNTTMLSVGYNGNYKGGPHAHESTEPGKSGFIHAEVNALVKCDFNFPKAKHMYVTHMPCKDCAKLIINAEITKVVYDMPYRLTEGVDLLKSVGVEVCSLTEAIVIAKR